MQVQAMMSRDPVCCDRESHLAEVARLMAQCDCGEIPVCDERGRPVGVVTDRHIVCRQETADVVERVSEPRVEF